MPNKRIRYSLESDFATADRFTEFAKKLDAKPATLAVAWTMSHPDVTAAIIGAPETSRSSRTPSPPWTSTHQRSERGDLRAIANPRPGHRPHRDPETELGLTVRVTSPDTNRRGFGHSTARNRVRCADRLLVRMGAAR